MTRTTTTETSETVCRCPECGHEHEPFLILHDNEGDELV